MSSTREGDRLAEVAVTRSRPERRTARRNLLSDFDVLVERALVASEEGRDPGPFVEDAVRVARSLAAPCGCGGSCRDHLERVVRGNLALALKAKTSEATQAAGEAAKRAAEKLATDDSKVEYSRSGRPVF